MAVQSGSLGQGLLWGINRGHTETCAYATSTLISFVIVVERTLHKINSP